MSVLSATDVIRVTPQELEFQETLIAEREAEIREIESGIHELNDIFRDLGTIVSEQGGLIGARPLASSGYGELTRRQHREQHHIGRCEHILGRGRAHHRARVPAEVGSEDGVLVAHPDHRCGCNTASRESSLLSIAAQADSQILV